VETVERSQKSVSPQSDRPNQGQSSASLHHSCYRPTHDQIEQLQSKVTELENLLRAVSDTEPAIVSEALHSWRENGLANAEASGSRTVQRNLAPSQTVDSHLGEDAEAPFETPPADQYIYDTTG
jgi:TolA-binding protein